MKRFWMSSVICGMCMSWIAAQERVEVKKPIISRIVKVSQVTTRGDGLVDIFYTSRKGSELWAEVTGILTTKDKAIIGAMAVGSEFTIDVRRTK